MRRKIVRFGGWMVLGMLALGGVPWHSTAKADDKWIQIGKGIFSANDQDLNGPHHASGRIAQVSWAWDNVQGKNVLWAGASHGGLWKTIIDGSGYVTSWVTITDNFPGSHELGSFAIKKGDSNYIVIGTGGTWGTGNGIYYTEKAGQDDWPLATFCSSTWSCGPAKPEHVSRLVADRLDSTGATLVAATSDGIWKSFDFGKTWFSMLSGVDATDVVQDTGDTGDPKSRWYAGVVNDGIYRSTDWASTWTADTSGIKGSIKRVSLAACNAEAQYLYALVLYTNNKLNVYRSADHGSTWEKISFGNESEIVNKDDQGGHALSIVCDPNDARHVFFGVTQAVETTNAKDKDQDVKWKKIDGGHSDYNFLLFHYDGKHLDIANDGGYYFYDIASGTPNAVGNLLGINALELGGLGNGLSAKTDAPYSTLQGGLASSWSNPDVFVAGLQDNGVVRGDISKDPAITRVSGGDGRHVSIMPENADVMGFADNGSTSIRHLSKNGGTTSKPVDFNLTLEKSAPVLIDPTPGLTAPRVFTVDQNLGDGSSSGIYWTDVFSNTGAFSPGPSWYLVSETAVPIPGFISNIDITVNPDRYQIAATVAGTPDVYLYHGPRDQLGSLTLSDIGPLNGFVMCGNHADGRINADRSKHQPKTLYYTTGRAHFIDCTTDGVEFRYAFVSRNAGSDWTDVTGDIASVSGNADLIKLIGNPGDETQYFLATSKGVFRGDRDPKGKVRWTDYSEGLRYHEQVDDIVINFNRVSKPTLYIATHGRGFWRRTID